MYPSDKDKQYFFDLLQKYNSGEATEQETAFVERFLVMMEHRNGDALADFSEQKGAIEKGLETRLLQSIRLDQEAAGKRPAVHRVHFLRRSGWWAAAAIALLLAGGASYYLLNKTPQPRELPNATIAAFDVKPGKEGAMLTLADGTKVLLDSMGNGVVALQGSTEVKLNNGQLEYNKAHGGQGTAVSYNTMSTPKGRQFQLLLPDGTRVWLNAASSLRYPTAFTGRERRVEITGEAYFEVAKNAHLPFTVSINDHTAIQVLGTHFNVNAYDDESNINTTLLEGSVKVTSNKQVQMLTPGQQAQVNHGSGAVKLVTNANVEEAMAWKNGNFSFNDASLPAVMRQLSRWYNIEVEYKGGIPAGTFSGEIGRSLTLDQVLKGLTRTKIRYTIEKDNKLLIHP